MQTIREFTRKTKRGNILKIVREHYLRIDLGCGSDICNGCQQEEDGIQLRQDRMVQSTLFNFPHYCVVDTNVVLHQIDILEEDAMRNVVVLSTVLNEVKHCSTVIYKRFHEVVQHKPRGFFVFVNEHHKDTYVERKPGETANDRNDRAIRFATKWYDEHISDIQKRIKKRKSEMRNETTRVVLITDDIANKEKADKEGILVATVEEYIKSLVDYPMLIDKYARRDIEKEKESTPLFPAHLSSSAVIEGVRNERLLQGAFMASRENFLEGSVTVEGFENPILLQGRESLNRAVDGDLVAVELLPESKWSAPSEVVLEESETIDVGDDVDKPVAEVLEEAAIKAAAGSEKRPTGRVVAIIRRKRRQYCGILQPALLEGATNHIFIPADRKIPRVRIETRQAEKLQNQRIIVAIDSWPRFSRYPHGHFVRSLGPLGDVETENEVILLEHDVPHCKFSEEVLSFLPKMPWLITPEDYEKRVDLRDLFICSVDPPGCTDIDDALHCRDMPNGNLEVGVHIADVSHFIRPGNALDNEAASRGTTVYLVGKRIDMVPDLLSSNLCSLRGGVERFAFSCIWEIDHNANVLAKKFHKSVIKSKAAMTYEQAQLIIDDKTQTNEIAQSLRNLNKLAKILKKRRMDNGALILASPEIRFQVDSETHEPLDVEAKQLRDTNSMVEEFMLLANITVAEHIANEFTECAMLRRHPRPPLSNFEPLIKAASYHNFDVKCESGLEFSKSLDQCVKDDNPYFNTMIRILATRCMMQALYFISGTLQKDQFEHYGLAAEIYTHFTSPIRRYSDIIVHRLLAASIGADSTYAQLLDKNANAELCHNLNYRHKMAQYAARASVALNTHLFFKEKVQDEEGYILFVRVNALQILIPKFGLEGTVYLKALKAAQKKSPSDVVFTFNEEDYTQRCGDVVFHSFDPVVVRLSLDSSNVQHEKLVFQLVKPYIKGFSVELDDAASCTKPKSKEVEIATTAAIPQRKKNKKSKQNKK